MESAAATEPTSFAKSLFLGEIHEEMVLPYPAPREAEQEKIRTLNASLRELASSWDVREWEKKRWIGNRTVRQLHDERMTSIAKLAMWVSIPTPPLMCNERRYRDRTAATRGRTGLGDDR